jgi:hypothetical protein
MNARERKIRMKKIIFNPSQVVLVKKRALTKEN